MGVTCYHIVESRRSCNGLNQHIKMASDLSRDEIEDITEVFDLFDFWDGRDGDVDAAKTSDMMYCLGLNPTLEQCLQNGGTEKLGEKGYKLEEFLPIFSQISKIAESGTFADFNEAFKTFDREGQGLMSAAEMYNVLTMLGERLKESEVNEIFKFTETKEDLDGNIKYADLINKILAGPEK